MARYITLDNIDNILTKYNQTLSSRINSKVEKETGKGLSSNDFTDAYKDKLDNLADSNSIEDITDSDITDLINSLDI